jgi:hypothetical protein
LLQWARSGLPRASSIPLYCGMRLGEVDEPANGGQESYSGSDAATICVA